MLVYGTVNPPGEKETHTGLYLTEQDISDIVESRSMHNKPILIEHKGTSVGRVVSAWKNNNRLDCVFEVDSSVHGLFARDFIENKKTPELSLGYIVEVEHSGSSSKRRKKIVEVSLVKKGARDNCIIHGFSNIKGN